MSQPTQLEAIPLGGLGEFGMNLMLYRQGDDCLIVDAGLGFPGRASFGVDTVVPDLTALDDCGTLHGVILTHGHDDHIGALPWLLAARDLPVYAPEHTRCLARGRLREHPDLSAPALRPLPEPGERLRLGPFEIEPLQVAHSIPQSRMIVLRCAAGTLLHTADFKLEGSDFPGQCTDTARLAALGREGLLALFSDSTNADRPGTTPGEARAAAGLAEQIRGRAHRVLVTCFSSHVERLSALGAIARREGRKLALAGTSLLTQAEIAEQLGLLRFPPGVRVPLERAMELPRNRVLIVATGSQAEGKSTLARIARGRHREIELDSGDLLLHSARVIPGHERVVGRLFDRLLQRGIEVVTARDAPIHVSGHGSADEMTRLIELTRPRYLVPIHGEYRQLVSHARLGVAAGLPSDRVLLARAGDVIGLDARRIEVVDTVPSGQVCLDAASARVSPSVLAERKRIASEGIVVPVVAFGRADPRVAPRIVSRGFVPGADGDRPAYLDEAERLVSRAVDEATPAERADAASLEERIRSDLRRFLRRTTHRQPLVLPVIVEL